MEYNACSVFCKSNGSILCVDILGVAERLEGIGFGCYAEKLTIYEFNGCVDAVGNSCQGHCCAVGKSIGFYVCNIEFLVCLEVIGVVVECGIRYVVEQRFALRTFDYYVTDSAHGIIGQFYDYPAGNCACVTVFAFNIDEVVAILCYFISGIYIAVGIRSFERANIYFLCFNAFSVDFAYYSVKAFLVGNFEETVADG